MAAAMSGRRLRMVFVVVVEKDRGDKIRVLEVSVRRKIRVAIGKGFGGVGS